jgi:hypothetical protein
MYGLVIYTFIREWTVVRRLCSKELRSAVTEGSVDSSFSNLTRMTLSVCTVALPFI